jgi:hypothetical protein
MNDMLTPHRKAHKLTHFEVEHAFLKPGKSDLRHKIGEYVGMSRSNLRHCNREPTQTTVFHTLASPADSKAILELDKTMHKCSSLSSQRTENMVGEG